MFNVFPALSDLFANAATTAEGTTVLLLWEATIGMAYTFFFVGTLFFWIGIIALGVAMLGAPAFGKGFGWGSVVLGAAGTVAASTRLFVPEVVVVYVLAILIFLLLFGWKVYRLSRAA